LDLWLKHYLAGQDAQANSDWSKLTITLRTPDELYNLMKRAVVRINFSDGKDDDQRKNNGNAAEAMVLDSEKAMGQSNLILIGAYDSAANTLNHSGKFGRAVFYKQKEIALRRKLLPGNDSRYYATMELANYLLLNHQLDQARKAAESVRPVLSQLKDQRVRILYDQFNQALTAKNFSH